MHLRRCDVSNKKKITQLECLDLHIQLHIKLSNVQSMTTLEITPSNPHPHRDCLKTQKIDKTYNHNEQRTVDTTTQLFGNLKHEHLLIVQNVAIKT